MTSAGYELIEAVDGESASRSRPAPSPISPHDIQLP